MNNTIIIATHNQGKAAEFKELFSEIGYQVKTLADFPEIGEIEETGNTFEKNALIKAETVANYLNLPTLADDSGLSVMVLLDMQESQVLIKPTIRSYSPN